MKDLIAIFAYCPDTKRKKILQDFLLSVQDKRDSYDIIVVSHSLISDFSYEMSDYFYYDSNNKLIEEFDLTNKFWFRDGKLRINSSLVYPVSTHLAIYRLLYYTINFAKWVGYEKVHFIEYDISLDNIDLIDEVNINLENYDNVMFKGEDGWIWGTYFASNLRTIQLENFIYNEKKILQTLSEEESRMTENITFKILSDNSRSILFESIEKIDKSKVCQKNDEHMNYGLKWCVPLVSRDGDELNFFIYNEKGGSYVVDVFVNNICKSFVSEQIGIWNLIPIGNLESTNKIEIFVDKKLRNTIVLNEDNKKKFKENNVFYYEE